MKTVFTILFLIFSMYSFAQNNDSIPVAGAYYEAKNIDLGFYGFQGKTVDLTFSKKKVCQTCYRFHSKMFGTGFEIGKTKRNTLVGGPKIYYQRGQNNGSFRIGIGMLTNFEHWIVTLRPEYMVHFFKDRSLSAGLAFNFSYNLELDRYEFGILSFAARYYLEFDKQS